MRVTPIRTEIIILATRTQNVLGEKGRRIRELTSVVQKRFGFPEGTVEVNSRSTPCIHSFQNYSQNAPVSAMRISTSMTGESCMALLQKHTALCGEI